MLLAFALIFSTSSIIISYKMRENYEHLLLLKLIGLFMLSVVTISLNTSIPIPAGFAAAFLISRISYNNRKPKGTCTLLGLLTTILCTLLYYIQ